MIVNNIEVPFKITRPADAAAFEKALVKMQKSELGYKTKFNEGKLSLSGMWLGMITMLSAFFKEATGVDVLGDVDDVDDAYAIYMQFIDEVNCQQQSFQKKYSSMQIDAEVSEED